MATVAAMPARRRTYTMLKRGLAAEACFDCKSSLPVAVCGRAPRILLGGRFALMPHGFELTQEAAQVWIRALQRHFIQIKPMDRIELAAVELQRLGKVRVHHVPQGDVDMAERMTHGFGAGDEQGSRNGVGRGQPE